jgi:hypothetical protein
MIAADAPELGKDHCLETLWSRTIAMPDSLKMLAFGGVAHHCVSFLLGHTNYEATTLFQIAFGSLFLSQLELDLIFVSLHGNFSSVLCDLASVT